MISKIIKMSTIIATHPSAVLGKIKPTIEKTLEKGVFFAEISETTGPKMTGSPEGLLG